MLPLIATHTVYTVTPDDHYYPNTTCHHCHNLQHYLLNITKYFTSNTQLLFLPGLHHLHTDLIIQNVHNISLNGSTANGTTLDTVIIQCDSSVGITMSNITVLTIANLVIDTCKTKNNVLNINNWIFTESSTIISHCYDVELQNITAYGSYGYTILAINILGISSFINIKSYGLTMQYNEENVDYKYNKLLIENYQMLFGINAIIIQLHQKSYKVELEFYNVKFIPLHTIDIYRLLEVTQDRNKCGNIIHFNKCFIENFDLQLGIDGLFYFELSEWFYEIYHQVSFTNCTFRHNQIKLLFKASGPLNMKLENCIFEYNHFQVIEAINLNSIIVANTSFKEIKTDFFLIQISNTLLNLEGSVIFNKVKADRILYVHNSTISYHGYIESSHNILSSNNHLDYVIIQENTLINMTNNKYNTIKEIVPYYYEGFSISNFTAPCYYQYNGEKQNFDKVTKTLNFSIVYHEDISIHTIIITHCRWLPGSVFNSTKPIDVNKRLIKSDIPSAYEKLICSCNNAQENFIITQDCYADTLATAYPGQTKYLSLAFNIKYYLKFKEISSNISVMIEINDDVLPHTACKLAEVKELIQKVSYSSCTIINFTVVHNGLGYLQWCELFINIISTNIIDAYYIDILPCPAGFVQQNGICICDPILKSTLISITTCNINDQTILRPAGSWLSAVTINDSHKYHISPHCPLHYCVPQSSQLNFSTPNSQCMFNRTGLLCGQCQQGLSTMFGSSHCHHCFNIYLLFIIPIAIAGVALVILLFILNLTVTDGDINGFILYVNIISINSHVFFLVYNNSINPITVFISLANLDLGIPTCFYNGMDDYAKMWLQLTFPAYLIVIATLFIIASRHSTKVQRITARRALPVLATLFLLSYTKVLRTVSSVLFYYSTITHLPSGHTTLVWAVDANVPLFGLKYTVLFIACLILFIILLSFNAILCFTKTTMRLKLINHFKPLIDAYQGPYKYKYYNWAGLQLVIRVVFFGLSAVDRNVNLTVGIILLAVIVVIQNRLIPFKDNYKNLHETGFLFNLLVMYALSHDHYDVAVNVMITMAALQFLLIIIHHIISNVCGGVIMHKLKILTNSKLKWITRSHNKPQRHIQLNNTPPDKAYNYQELREPLVGED